MIKKTAIVATLLIAVAALSGAYGQDRSSGKHRDQDEARAALREGKSMPLTAILEIVAKREPGIVVAVELESHRGRLFYEIRVLRDDGRKRELRLDARSGEILSAEND